jgi:hypothetical protein
MSAERPNPDKDRTASKEAIGTMLRNGFRKGGVTLALMLLAGIAALAPPALAAPSYEVSLERDRAQVSHSDERLDYTVEVANVAAPGAPTGVGDTLTCYPGGWTQSGAPEFSFQWLRGGEEIAGATGQSYEVAPADAGEVIQCRLLALNTIADVSSPSEFAGRVHVIGRIVVDPQPAVEPPTPPSSIASPSQSGALTVGGAGGQTLTCNPGTWKVPEGSPPPTFSYSWFRNGQRIAGATASTYVVTMADVATRAAFQCMVTGTNAGGSVSASSNLRNTSPVPSPTAPGGPGVLPVLATDNYTRGEFTVELELPGGERTFVFEAGGSGWDCDKIPPSGSEPAKAICTTTDVLAPGGDSTGPLEVVAGLGSDAPDAAVARATAFGGGASTAASTTDGFDFEPFKQLGLVDFEAGLCAAPPAVLGTSGICFDQVGADDDTRAGGHPYAGAANFELTKKRTLTIENSLDSAKYAPVEHAKDITVELPRGQVGNALAIEEFCPSLDLVRTGSCPTRSLVGAMEIEVKGFEGTGPIAAVKPERGTPAQFAFSDFANNVYTFSTRLRPRDNYAISFEVASPPKVDFLSSVATICNFGVIDLMDVGFEFGGCREPGEPGANPRPLFTNPTRCGAPAPVTATRLSSWENPEVERSFSFTGPQMQGCDSVDFEPTVEKLAPGTDEADSATGLDLELTMPTDGLEDPEGTAQANLKRATVTFPEGMAVNPTAGKGLGACGSEQIKLGTNDPISCPDASKIGTVEVETPIIEDTLKGAVYIAKQGEVDGSLIGFYLVFASPENGILVKVPAKVEPDPETGQLVATVDESPEAPFSTVRMHFPGGERATLLTPPKCGTYEIEAELVPWSGGDPVTQTSSFEVTSGPNGGRCPTDALLPSFNAGVTNPLAGNTSPFVVRLSREDGTDRFTALGLKMPAGLTAYLKGVPYCPEAVLAAISSDPGTGQDEIDAPSCPAQSQIGRVVVGAGAGPNPFYTEAPRAYLAGPYKGAPLSIAVVAPAVAGPLDLGNVVVRNAIHVNPVTAEISVVSDPIPHILHGLLLDVRDVRVLVDRPAFTLNPSGCEAKQVAADVKGLVETGIAQLQNHFQVGGCEALGFKPKTRIRLFGGIKRGAYQGVRAVVRPRPGDSNISRTAVRFPRSAFVAQEHIRTVCTRVQFAADACPKGSIYGKAIAYSPLIDYPLEGNVYLRSSDNTLPDAVADLRGPAHQPLRVEVAIINDSVKGTLRNTVQAVPDAPVSYFRLQMFGGQKGLIVNSRNICAKNQATVAMAAHNGRRSTQRVNVFNKRCKKLRKARRKAAKKLKRTAAQRRAD